MKLAITRGWSLATAPECVSILVLVGLMIVGTVEAQNLPPGTNIDEAKVETYTLPDPLILADGKRVGDSRTWMMKRRPEIMRLFEDHQYGHTPQKKLRPKYDVWDKDSPALDGKALRTQVRIRFSDDPATPTLRLLLYTPAKARGPVPTLLHLGFSPNALAIDDPGIEEGFGWDTRSKQRVPGRQARKIGGFPAMTFLDRGFGVALIYYGDIDPDFDGGAIHGIRTLFGDASKERGPADWGSIGAWGWGLSRILDYLQTNPRVDGKRVALSGASRLGKAVLWAGALDQRFAAILPLVSGEGGAALSRRNFGETVADLVSPTRYHYWFAKNYARYAKNVEALPVDAHMLIAMIAPRPILMVTGSTDNWSDPKGEFLAAVAAEPVYELFGKRGLGTKTFPAPETPILNDIGYFMHDGPHGTLPGDYTIMAQFMEKHFAANAGREAKQSAAEQPKLRFIQSNGIKMRIAEMGKGPLVILVHGWPESWYSWRHQLPALSAAGYRAVAPDMRGYGKTDKPPAVEDYDIQHLTADLAGIVDALGEKEAILIGHDWGAIVSWQAMLLYPKRFKALVAMSVPYSGRGAQSIVQGLRRAVGENFHYILYFQEPGVAEKEFDADPRAILSRLYLSPDSAREAPQVTDPKRVAGGWIARLGAPKGLPSWLTQAELDYYVAEFKEAGFRGGISYYRNFHRNWETTPQLAEVKISAPVLFLAGDKDVVIRGASAEALTASMKNAVPGLRGVTLIPNTGHWVQQERPAATNEAILQFLKGLDR